MSETNDSGNRWEQKPADGVDHTEGSDVPAEAAAAVPDPVSEAAVPDPVPDQVPEAAVPVPGPRRPRRVTARGLVAAGAAAAILVVGGSVGYAVGTHHDDGHRDFPGRFERAGFDGRGPGGQLPGIVPPGGEDFGGSGFDQGQGSGGASGAEGGASS